MSSNLKTYKKRNQLYFILGWGFVPPMYCHFVNFVRHLSSCSMNPSFFRYGNLKSSKDWRLSNCHQNHKPRQASKECSVNCWGVRPQACHQSSDRKLLSICVLYDSSLSFSPSSSWSNPQAYLTIQGLLWHGNWLLVWYDSTFHQEIK